MSSLKANFYDFSRRAQCYSSGDLNSKDNDDILNLAGEPINVHKISTEIGMETL